MRINMTPFIYLPLLICHVSLVTCQRYAERNPLPADTFPVVDNYDDYATESYDFNDETDVYRWNVKDYPQPQDNPRYCNRIKPSYVCDPDSVIMQDEADQLDIIIKRLYDETPCPCDSCGTTEGGIIVGIALMKYIYQPYNEHPSKIIRSFSERMRQKWKLGKCDNDILIVVAKEDRLSYTDVGSATSSYVSLQEAHRIFLEHKGHFSAGHFFEGLKAMLSDYHNRTLDIKSPVKDKINVGVIAGAVIGSVVLLGIILFLVILFIKKRRSSKASGKRGEEIDSNSEGVASSWRKQDIKMMLSSLKSTNKQQTSTKYQPCETEEKPPTSQLGDEEFIDTSLALPVAANDTQLTSLTSPDTSATEMLEKDLTEAAEGIAQTFETCKPKREYTGHMTDL